MPRWGNPGLGYDTHPGRRRKSSASRAPSALLAGDSGNPDDLFFNSDGIPRKVMDVSRLGALGATARTPLENGFSRARERFAANAAPFP